jgi:hypothetical protein
MLARCSAAVGSIRDSGNSGTSLFGAVPVLMQLSSVESASRLLVAVFSQRDSPTSLDFFKLGPQVWRGPLGRGGGPDKVPSWHLVLSLFLC